MSRRNKKTPPPASAQTPSAPLTDPAPPAEPEVQAAEPEVQAPEPEPETEPEAEVVVAARPNGAVDPVLEPIFAALVSETGIRDLDPDAVPHGAAGPAPIASPDGHLTQRLTGRWDVFVRLPPCARRGPAGELFPTG